MIENLRFPMSDTFVDEGFEDTINQSTRYRSIEYPRSTITAVGLVNLQRLVSSKRNLIKKALAVESLDIIINDEKISFPWINDKATEMEVKYIMDFIEHLISTANKRHHVSVREKEVENERYVFRIFLVRIGLIGVQHKEARKYLLNRLSGCTTHRQ